MCQADSRQGGRLRSLVGGSLKLQEPIPPPHTRTGSIYGEERQVIHEAEAALLLPLNKVLPLGPGLHGLAPKAVPLLLPFLPWDQGHKKMLEDHDCSWFTFLSLLVIFIIRRFRIYLSLRSHKHSLVSMRLFFIPTSSPGMTVNSFW